MLLLCSLFIKRKEILPENLENAPFVSLIIAVYNEEKVIRAKLENSLRLNYPEKKLEIIVASDGSTDRTNEIVRSFENRGIKLYQYERVGKTGIQNETVKKAKGEILVFSDANAIYHKDAIRKLVRNFFYDGVGCVCGQLFYRKKDGTHFASGEILYWKYENFLKNKENRISSLIGANGSIYAIRKSDYVEIDVELISDLVEPLEIVKRGKRVAYEPEAISYEESSSFVKEEFNRKVRILTRSIFALLHMKCLFDPLSYGIFAIQLLVHKMLRYLVPLFLMTGALSLVFLIENKFYFVLFCLLMVLSLLTIVGKFSRNKRAYFRLFNLIYYYAMVNYALIFAWINIVRGRKITVWRPERN